MCSVEGCEKPHAAKGYCQMHYRRIRRNGDLTKRRNSGRPKHDRVNNGPSDVRYSNGHGYVRLYYPEHPNASKSGALLEHIYIMSQYLGRPLFSHENVHHINGDRADNRIENLELWSRSQPAGQRVEDKIRHAIEFLKEYGIEVKHG